MVNEQFMMNVVNDTMRKSRTRKSKVKKDQDFEMKYESFVTEADRADLKIGSIQNELNELQNNILEIFEKWAGGGYDIERDYNCLKEAYQQMSQMKGIGDRLESAISEYITANANMLDFLKGHNQKYNASSNWSSKEELYYSNGYTLFRDSGKYILEDDDGNVRGEFYNENDAFDYIYEHENNW